MRRLLMVPERKPTEAVHMRTVETIEEALLDVNVV